MHQCPRCGSSSTQASGLCIRCAGVVVIGSDAVASMRLPDGLSALMLEATDQGYDVTITMRRRTDSKPGVVTMPNEWVRRLGGDPEAIRESRTK